MGFLMTPHGQASGYDSDWEDYERECRKFRICIIGRAGVGKSTLLSRVFGVSDEEARVRHSADALHRGGGVHNIWDGITDETRNRALVIHDSRGFEASETESIQTVKQFIEYRSNKGSLPEQLHCMWYCLSLADVRPLQQSERQFFRFFSDKGIPLVFVLTKYDKLIRDRLDTLAVDDENPTPEERARAKDDAKAFVEKFRGELEAAVERGVKVQEVSNKPKDNALVQKLVAETTAIVKPNLRNVWIRAQGVLATQKRAACIKEFPLRAFSRVLTQCSIPLNPLKASMLADFFERAFHHCMAVWNLPGQSSLFTKDYIIESFREATQSYITITGIAATLDLAGPLTAPLYVRLATKIACDLIMIFQQLFWATPRKHILTRKDLQRQLDIFEQSKIRRTIHALVDGYIGATAYITAYQPEKINEIIGKVVGASHILIADELRSKEKLDVDEVPLPELPC